MDSSTVLNTITQHAVAFRGFGVRRLGLFGSAVRGESGPNSDLDFLVELERPTFDSYMDTKFYLEDLFGCKIDLVMVEALKPRLREIILAEAVYAPGL